MIWNKWNAEEKTKIQRQLLQFTCEKTAAFLAEHPSETFYAFTYDCNTEYGQVSLCLNSEEFFQEGLSRSRAEFPEYYSSEEDIREYRYNTGNWQYQCFDTFTFIEEDEIDHIHGQIDGGNIDEWFALIGEFRTMCRETVREFAGNDVFAQIPKTAGFLAYAVDHEESIEEALQHAVSV